ncbi:hypothetical protein, partial [Acidisoma sp. L85]|uniref:hypothetical protein n=1 Tax=Acidisoma sp. L85 TaxID=1641850 RepID=UPI001C2034AD
MNDKDSNAAVSPRLQLRGVRLRAARARYAIFGFTAPVAGAVASMAITAHAFAQAATPSTAGIGAQVQQMAQEGSTTGGFVGSMAMYGAALICMVGGAWALWQSRQPQNRESGRVAMGCAGLVLAGLFATGGTWINKAANTASGANSTISSTAGTVTFGTGGLKRGAPPPS